MKIIGKNNVVEDLTFEEILAKYRTEGQELYNPMIVGGTISDPEIVYGSGNEVWKVDKNGIYLGNANWTSAVIKMSYDGTFYASNAEISGTITATSGAIGGWDIAATTLTATSIILDSGNERIEVGASNPILIDGANKRIRSDNYVSGYAGSGFNLDPNLLEVGNIACRGLIRTSVFQKDVISAMGGNFIVLGADVLDADMDATDAETLTTKATTTFSVGDILRIKDGTDDEWLEVTAVNGAVYTCNRDKKGDYAANTNPTWKKGATVVNYGQTGDGGVYMTASESNAPYLSVFTHAGSPWTDLTTRLRIGNLNGYLGYSSDLYGIGIGDATHYLKYDPTNHLRISGTITGSLIQTAASGQRVELNTTYAGMRIYNSSGNQVLYSAGFEVGTILTISPRNNDETGLHIATAGVAFANTSAYFTSTGLNKVLHLKTTNGFNTEPLLYIENGGLGNDITANNWSVARTGKITCEGLNAGTNKIENVVDPTADQEAATKKYVDDADDDINSETLTAGNDIVIRDAVYLAEGNETNLISQETMQVDTYKIYAENRWGQTFTTSAYGGKITKVALAFLRVGTPTGNFTVSIRATDGNGKPTGNDLIAKTVTAASIDCTGNGWNEFEFASALEIDPDTKYAVLAYCPDGTFENYFYINTTNSDVYDGGDLTNIGSLYGYDAMFKVWEYPTVNRIYKTDANDGKYFKNFIGFATEAIAEDASGVIQRNGTLGGFSGLTVGKYYLSNTAGAIATTPGENREEVGRAISATEIMIKQGRERQYREIAAPAWTDVTTASTWEDWDLSSVIPFGAEYADILIYMPTSGYTGGVREKGSSISRTIAGHGGTAQPNLLVKLDDNRIVQRYATNNTAVKFTVVGYWI